MENLLLIALAILVVYLAATIIVFGIPCSISNTYYLWHIFNLRFLFTFVIWAVGVLTVIYWEHKCAGRYEFLPFLSVSGMMFVGAAAAFKETLTRGTHYTAAAVWAASAIAFFALIGDWQSIVIGAVAGLAGCAINRFRNLTFWAEIAVVFTIFTGLLML